MGWGRVFGGVLRLGVLVVCVGLVGCRLSEGGSVDELRLLEVSQATGNRQQVTEDILFPQTRGMPCLRGRLWRIFLWNL